VDVRLVRIFNTYGPRMHPEDGRVVSTFIVQALQNKPLTIYGRGTQTRSFCYVDDLIEAMIRTMDQDETVGPINIGNPEEIPIRTLAVKIIAATRSESTITELPLPTDDPKQRRPDISRAKQFLNWEPAISFAEGLPKTIDYFTHSGPAGANRNS